MEQLVDTIARRKKIEELRVKDSELGKSKNREYIQYNTWFSCLGL